MFRRRCDVRRRECDALGRQRDRPGHQFAVGIFDRNDEVWVRRRMSGERVMKKVSWVSRAGCSGGKFRAEKTCQSSSTSGPSEMVKPRRVKMEMISLRTTEIG